MPRVIILQHDEHRHRATGVHFKPETVRLATTGKRVTLGIADVTDAEALEYFRSKPDIFLVVDGPSVERPVPSLTAPAGGPATSPTTTDTGLPGASTGAPPVTLDSDALGTPVELLPYERLKELAGAKGNVPKLALLDALKTRGITHDTTAK